MPSENEIFRPATELEKQSFVEIPEGGTTNILDLFMNKLAEVKTKFLKDYKPYDSYGARVEFEELIRKNGYDENAKVNKIKGKKVEQFDLDRYGEYNRFNLINITDVIEQKIAGSVNSKIAVVTGKNYEYKTKERGNGMTIFVPSEHIAAVEKMIEENFKNDLKKIAKLK